MIKTSENKNTEILMKQQKRTRRHANNPRNLPDPPVPSHPGTKYPVRGNPSLRCTPMKAGTQLVRAWMQAGQVGCFLLLTRVLQAFLCVHVLILSQLSFICRVWVVVAVRRRGAAANRCHRVLASFAVSAILYNLFSQYGNMHTEYGNMHTEYGNHQIWKYVEPAVGR